MKKTIRSAIALVLTASMALSAAACSSKTNKKSKKKVISENDPYFEATEKELKVNYDASKEIESASLYNYQILGDTIAAVYYISYKMPKDVEKKMEKMDLTTEKGYEEWLKLYDQYSENGTVFFNFDLEEVGRIRSSANESVNRYFEGPNGEIMALVTTYTMKKTSDNLKLCEFSKTGEKVKETDFSGELDDVWNGQVKFLPDGKMMVVSYEGIYLLDGNGKKIGEIKDQDFSGTVLEQDGKYYALTTSWNADYTSCTGKISEIDVENCKLVNPVEMDAFALDDLKSGKSGTYSVDENAIRKVDVLGKNDPEVVLDWNDTDIVHSDIYAMNLYVKSPDEIYMFREEYIDAKNKSGMETKIYMTQLKRQDKNPNAGKQVIEMGCNGMPSDTFQKYIVEYNKDPNKKSRIILHDYSQETVAAYMKSGEKGLSDVLNTLYLDMLSHSGPDILYDFGNYSQFNSDKILLDLNTCIDGANGLSRDQYFDNIFRASELNGKLYQMPISMSIVGYAANKNVVGDRDGWTYDEFDQIMSNLPNKMMVFDTYLSKNTVMVGMLGDSIYDFIDYDQKKVSFNSDAFKKILEICKKYGNEEIDYSAISSLDMGAKGLGEENEDKFENDLLALEELTLYGFSEYMTAINERKGNVVLIGTPSDTKKGLSAYATSSIAISAASDYQEDAWDFIRFLFQEEMQNKIGEGYGGIPVHKNATREIAKQEIKEYNENKQRWKESPDEFYDLDGNDPYPLDMKESDVDKFMDMISHVDRSVGYDQTVMNVITEEVKAFFAGQRSVDDVCKIIQDKAQTIVSER